MSRSSKVNLLYDSEIEKTAKRLRKEAKERKRQNLPESQTAPSAQTEAVLESDSSNPAVEGVQSAQTERIYEEEEEVEEEAREFDLDLVLTIEGEMAANDPRLCDLASHEEDDPPTPIQMPELTTPIEIKLGFLNVLPKFYGKKGEDPYNL